MVRSEYEIWLQKQQKCQRVFIDSRQRLPDEQGGVSTPSRLPSTVPTVVELPYCKFVKNIFKFK